MLRVKRGSWTIVARKGETLHFIEVKVLVCKDFPAIEGHDHYDLSENLHTYKVRKVVRTSEWYMADIDWEGESQVDGVLVWFRSRQVPAANSVAQKDTIFLIEKADRIV